MVHLQQESLNVNLASLDFTKEIFYIGIIILVRSVSKNIVLFPPSEISQVKISITEPYSL